MVKALLLNQEDKKTIARLTEIAIDDLPEGEVLVDVACSSINYKDGLAVTGKAPVVTQFPMVPGIDCAGTVVESTDDRYQAGDKVILTGWGVGEGHWGGMAQKARFKADWLVPMPAGCDETKAMQIGTAGLTAMLCVQALLDGGVQPESGPVLVTGASGGVGSVAVTLLAQLGYEVVACSSRVEANGELLEALGAARVIDRRELDRDARPLEKQLWAGLVDTVGNKVLATALSQMKYDSVAAICGLAGGFALPTTVMPFILRGVRLQGIDSVYCSFAKRQAAWERIVNILPDSFFAQACEAITLEQVEEYANRIIRGQITGRVLVQL
ncbi:MDR family oxidoreductase [Shewanella sp. GXUN23E]|uniref:MDR family oxidoreductase n=1 Tax=Shewanella sp. GXUN23E TaxID=3422498 RepID=UPI003D7E5BDE